MTSVAVIGTGVIGRAQIRMFSRAGYGIVTYDVTDTNSYPHAEIRACAFAVICVGTPERPDGRANLSYLHEALDDLPAKMPALIRSTIPPGTMDELNVLMKQPVAHAPEFMHEREGGAWRDSTDVPFLILGGRPGAREFFRPHLSGFFPKVHETSGLTAELVKYVINLHLAARITFVNEMAQIAAQFGADWEDVRHAWLMDPRITPEYTGMAGFEPGFGGRCWPKDLSALIAASEDAGYDPEFLKAVQDANKRFRHG